MIKFLNMHVSVPVIVLGVLDFVLIYFSIGAGLALSYAPEAVLISFFVGEHALQKVVFAWTTSMSLFVIGAYSRAFLTNMKMGLIAIIVSHVLSFALLSIASYVYPDLRIWLSALLPGLLFSLTGVFLTHLAFDRIVGTHLFKRNLLVIGAGSLARKIAILANQHPHLTCVGCLPISNTKIAIPEDLILRDSRSLPELARHLKVDEIVVAVEERRNQSPTEQLLQCRLNGIQISEPSSFIEWQDGRVELDGLHPSWMIFGTGFSSVSIAQRTTKRVFDFIVSASLLAFFLLLMILIGVTIWAVDGRPIFYRQTRVGLNGRNFTIWKFRSMAREAEADGVPRWASSSDARTTFLGRLLRRLRMDELPQLWNVFKGDMSFIGPRPERPEFVEKLVAQTLYYEFRHVMKPGISGWAQINYPYGASFDDAKDKLNYDLYYIKNYSLALDCVILLQTLRIIIWPERGTRARPAADRAAFDERWSCAPSSLPDSRARSPET